jgi:hypothetical protein
VDVLQAILSAVFGAAGGVVALVTGLSGFLGRIWADRIVEAQRAKFGTELALLRGQLDAEVRRLQGEIDKTILVHRAHFDTEFNALKDIWRKVAHVRSVFNELKPPRHRDAQGPSEGSRIVSDALAELIMAIDSQSPFYPKDIYDDLDNLRAMVKQELAECDIGHPHEPIAWARRREQGWTELTGRVTTISDKIRDRLARLTITSG